MRDFSEYDPFDTASTPTVAGATLPGVDVTAVAAVQREGLEAVRRTQELAWQGLEALTLQQAQVTERATQTMNQMFAFLPTLDGAARGANVAMDALARAMDQGRQMAELVSRSQHQALDQLDKQVAQGMDVVRAVVDSARH